MCAKHTWVTTQNTAPNVIDAALNLITTASGLITVLGAKTIKISEA